MNLKLSPHPLLFVFLLLLFVKVSSFAQCVDSNVRPSDNFTLTTWSPRCFGGNDGEIRIANISSILGTSDFTNSLFTVRVLSGPGAPMHFVIPSNASNYTITGLVAGNYVVDIMDACGGNSSDKTITVINPSANSAILRTEILMKDRFADPSSSTCGALLKYKVSTLSTGTGGSLTYVFTNNLGATMSFTNTITQSNPLPGFSWATFDVVLPFSFFNSGDLQYTVSNSCGSLVGGNVTFPSVQDIVFDTPRIKDASNPNAICSMGFDLKFFRNNTTNPVQISVVERDQPNAVALNIYNQPIVPQQVDLTHVNMVAAGGSVAVSLGLRFDVDYVVTLVDACGVTIQHELKQQSVPFQPSVSCGAGYVFYDYFPYFDDVTYLNFNELPISSLAVGPLTVTFNSGPAEYTTQSGDGVAVTTSNAIQYPYSIVLPSANLSTLLTYDNSFAFAPGTYNFTVTDACGKTNTFDYTTTCARNTTITHALNYCGDVNEMVEVYITMPKDLIWRHVSIYNSAGVPVISGLINYGAPFYFFHSGNNTITIKASLPNNQDYFFRYGGVSALDTPSGPIQLGGLNALPRLVGGYLYEYKFRTELTPFHFSSIDACHTTVDLVATGGGAPYEFALLDASGSTLLAPYQTSATFTNLVGGLTYTAKVKDACGREFSQQFLVYEAPEAAIASVVQPTCLSDFGAVTFSGLPTNWKIEETTTQTIYTGVTPTFTVDQLLAGTYHFIFTDNATQCSNSNALTVVFQAPICPIASDDLVLYTNGIPVHFDVSLNDVQGALVDPSTVQFVAPSTATNLILSSLGEIKGLEIPNEGTWSINNGNGMVVFTPFSSFTGTPTAINYTIKDFNGTVSNQASIGFDAMPIASDDALAYTAGVSTSLLVLQNDIQGDLVDPQTLALVHANGTTNEIIVANEGVWTVNTLAGTIDFTPVLGFTGVPQPQYYTVKDYQGNVSNVALISLSLYVPVCEFEVSCPVFTTTTVSCASAIPTTTVLTIAEFEALGNGEGVISGSDCGIVEIIAENIGELSCGTLITRTYTVTLYEDTNSNGSREANETSVLETFTCSQVFEIVDTIAPVFSADYETVLNLDSIDAIPSSDLIFATDTCGAVAMSYDEVIEEGLCIGSYKVIRKWGAVDLCGNESFFTQIVQIEDQIAPVFSSQIAPNLYISCNEIPSVPEVIALDDLSNVTIRYEETSIGGDCSSLNKVIRTWSATDECGNVSELTQTLHVACDVKVYNALSPDGDGKNDLLLLEGIECYPNNSITIFNRYGEKVFEVSGYDNRSTVFNGTSTAMSNTNTTLPTGTYFYVLNYEYGFETNEGVSRKEQSGYLYIKKE